MFSIFQKNEFLIDHLEGITDIHNHILPGIDDGAKNKDESIDLLKQFKEIGIEKFICTPHIMSDFYPNTNVTIGKSLKTLISEIKSHPEFKNVQINAAAEYMMDQAFIDLLENEKLLVLKDNMVLVEMSYFQAPINLNEILFKLTTKGYKPVLAHPERYAFFHSKDLRKYEDLKYRGCMFQINSLSLTNYYGRGINKTALQLLNRGMIDFIGSDIHRVQHHTHLKEIKMSRSVSKLLRPVIQKTKFTF
jgi:protein-tyrosine phosphatase